MRAAAWTSAPGNHGGVTGLPAATLSAALAGGFADGLSTGGRLVWNEGATAGLAADVRLSWAADRAVGRAAPAGRRRGRVQPHGRAATSASPPAATASPTRSTSRASAHAGNDGWCARCPARILSSTAGACSDERDAAGSRRGGSRRGAPVAGNALPAPGLAPRDRLRLPGAAARRLARALRRGAGAGAALFRQLGGIRRPRHRPAHRGGHPPPRARARRACRRVAACGRRAALRLPPPPPGPPAPSPRRRRHHPCP